jgi:uncharacterized membrane protein YraQ (UPF0718 family)
MSDAGMEPELLDVRAAARARTQGLVGVGLVLAVLIIGLLWAKWLPYWHKTHLLAGSRTWSGSPIFSTAGAAGTTPSLHGAWSFWTTYFTAVWKAAVVALLVAAATESLVPRRWLARLLGRRTWVGQGLAGGVLAMPSMMCTCCTAPVAVGLRRRGAPLGATVAYWLANPLLNPAVLVFLALTLPWRFTMVRLVVGGALVVASAALAARWSQRTRPYGGPPLEGITGGEDAAVAWSQLPLRFVRALGRYLLILVPEYVLVVLLTGWLSGWLADFAGIGHAAGPLSLLLVGVVGTALVVPTGGEIPVIAGLVAAGSSAGVAGVLLVTLPALSVPSMVMVARTLSWRLVAALAGLVVVGGIAAGALLAAIH